MSICYTDPAQGLSLGYYISGGYYKPVLSLYWKQQQSYCDTYVLFVTPLPIENFGTA